MCNKNIINYTISNKNKKYYIPKSKALLTEIKMFSLNSKSQKNLYGHPIYILSKVIIMFKFLLIYTSYSVRFLSIFWMVIYIHWNCFKKNVRAATSSFRHTDTRTHAGKQPYFTLFPHTKKRNNIMCWFYHKFLCILYVPYLENICYP